VWLRNRERWSQAQDGCKTKSQNLLTGLSPRGEGVEGGRRQPNTCRREVKVRRVWGTRCDLGCTWVAVPLQSIARSVVRVTELLALEKL
jgi:hypothetical protein